MEQPKDYDVHCTKNKKANLRDLALLAEPS